MSGNLFSCYVMGEESLLIQCTEILLERGHDVRGIIANAPAITNWATEKGLAVFAPGKALAETLTKQPPFDYFLSITNLRIIPDAILALPKRGAINFHDGPLPKFAGLYATSWALLHQADQHGVTWHEMRSGIDKGDILVQQLFDIAKGETAFTLNVKAYEAAIATFAELVTGIETNSLQPRAQNLAEQTYFGKYDRPAAAATLDWNQPAEKLVALVNALQFGGYANPLALPKLNLNGRLLTLTAAKPGDPTNAAPGTIIAVDNESITVATANGSVVLSGLQTLDGTAVSHTQFTVNQQLPSLDATAIADLTALNDAIVRQEGYWLRRLAEMSAVELPYADHSSTTIGQNYATTELGMDEATAQGYNIAAMIIFASSRFISTFLLKYVSPGRLLMILAIGGLLLTLGTIFLQGKAGLYSLVGISACMSLMFPTIYGIALEGIGEDAKIGAAGLIMAILGGSVMPPLQGAIIDMGTVFDFSAVRVSFVLPLLSFMVITVFGYRAFKIYKN